MNLIEVLTIKWILLKIRPKKMDLVKIYVLVFTKKRLCIGHRWESLFYIFWKRVGVGSKIKDHKVVASITREGPDSWEKETLGL